MIPAWEIIENCAPMEELDIYESIGTEEIIRVTETDLDIWWSYSPIQTILRSALGWID